MKRLRLIYPILVLLLCPIKGVAQGVEQLSDSLVYSIAMYSESYNEYKRIKKAFQDELFQLIKEVSLTTSGVGINTKLENIGIDAFTIYDLVDVLNKKYGTTITEEQAKIAMIQANAQMMQQRAQQFLMEDPDAQASQISDAEQQIAAQEAAMEEPVIE